MKLCHVVSLIQGKKKDALEAATAALRTLQHGEEFKGYTKKYEPYADDDNLPGPADKVPDEDKQVKHRVWKLIQDGTRPLAALANQILTQDLANQEAQADLVVDGNVMRSRVPVTTLMQLQKLVEHLRTLIAAVPTPDLGTEWIYDPSADLLRSASPAITQRTAKKPEAFTKAPATDKHPAQVDTYFVDKPVGDYRRVDYHGGIPLQQKENALARVAALEDAIKEALQDANQLQVDGWEEGFGQKLVDYAIAPLLKA